MTPFAESYSPTRMHLVPALFVRSRGFVRITSFRRSNLAKILCILSVTFFACIRVLFLEISKVKASKTELFRPGNFHVR